jgi:hypothetical protein
VCDCWPFCAYVVGPRLQNKIRDIGLEMEAQLTKLNELTEQDDLETKYKVVFGSIEAVCSNYKDMKVYVKSASGQPSRKPKRQRLAMHSRQ